MSACPAPIAVPEIGAARRRAAVVQISAVCLLLAAMYTGILRALALEWWTDPAASHGMLIPPLVLYLVWMQRNATFSRPAAADARGLTIAGAACALYLAGLAGAEFFLLRVSFILLLAGLAWTFWGLPRLRTLGFPLLLLSTMVPLPAIIYNRLAAPLQLFASRVAAEVARAMDVVVYRDGNVIHLAGIQLGVAEACSGLHSLSALAVAALLLGFLEEARPWARAALVALSVPLAIAVNVLRVAGTAVLADYRPQLAMGFYHSFSGWLVFLAGFSGLWLIAKALMRLERRVW